MIIIIVIPIVINPYIILNDNDNHNNDGISPQIKDNEKDLKIYFKKR